MTIKELKTILGTFDETLEVMVESKIVASTYITELNKIKSIIKQQDIPPIILLRDFE